MFAFTPAWVVACACAFAFAFATAGCDADAKRCLTETDAGDERVAACKRACNERKNVDACEALETLEEERAGSRSLDELAHRLHEDPEGAVGAEPNRRKNPEAATPRATPRGD